MRFIITLIFTSACNFIGEKGQESRLDPDNDGVLWPDDCNDNNPSIGAQQTWYIDEDGDGYGTDDSEIQSCAVPQMGVASGGDCDDADANSYPDAVEIWYNGIDNDCMGGNDFDADGDGEESSSYDGLDCNDDNPEIYSTATEIYYDGIDQDCDGNANECDADGDGFNGSANGIATTICPDVEDCDDSDSTIFPNDAEEIPFSGIDEDCNLQTGDGDMDRDGFWAVDYEIQMANSGVDILVAIPLNPRDCWDTPDSVPVEYAAINGFPQIDAAEVYPDALDVSYDAIDANCLEDEDFDQDGDGITTDSYQNRQGEVGEDCDDQDPNIFPGAIDEFYDGINANCDNQSDFDQDGDGDIINGLDLNNDGVLETSWDFDGDGINDFIGGNDCNDIDPTINSFEFELPADGVDQDCNTMELCYLDTDNDGVGTNATGESSNLNCNAAGFSNRNTDCADNNVFAFPGAAESESSTTCMLDSDEDGYGDTSPSDSNITAGTDCDDGQNTINPGVQESVDDGVDQNCDGFENCFIDADNDGYRTISTNLTLLSVDMDCDDAGEGSSTDPPLDCNDANPLVNPLATEFCDGIDNNCLDGVDESTAVDASTWYADLDNDGYGDPNNSTTACNGGSTYVADNSDCDDTDTNVNPAQTEVPNNGVDDDCNPATPSSLTSASDSVLDISGTMSGEYFGLELLNLDFLGTNTLVVTSDNEHGLSNGPTNCGSVTLIHDINNTPTEYAIHGEPGMSLRSASLAELGDLNNDGLPELAIGSPYGCYQGYGKVYILNSGSQLNNNSPNQVQDLYYQGEIKTIYDYGYTDYIFGYSLHSLTSGLLVGTPYDYGAVRYYSSSTLSQFSYDHDSINYDTEFYGTAMNAFFGSHISSGDLDGNGLEDVIIGASDWSSINAYNNGRIYVFDGFVGGNISASSADWTVSGQSGMHIGGEFITSDVNDDGYDDLIIGSEFTQQVLIFQGSAARFNGNVNLELEPADIRITAPNGFSFGSKVEVLGDVNGDGYHEIGIGDPDKSNYGTVHMLYGPLSNTDYSESDMQIITGTPGTPNFGYSMTSTGDLNSDGVDDFTVGAPSFYDSNKTGSVHLFHGTGQ